MAFNRAQVDLFLRSPRDDINLDFPFISFYRHIGYTTLDSSTTVLTDGYFNRLAVAKIGDLLHIAIVDNLKAHERVLPPIYLLVQVIEISPDVRVSLILSNEGGGGGPPFTGSFIVYGTLFTVNNGRITSVTSPSPV